MKKILWTIFILIIFITGFSFSSAQVEYEPISPVPNVLDCEEGASCEIPPLEDYLNRIFIFSIGIAAILAVLQVAFGGIEYITSSSSGQTGKAKERIRNAIIGILVLLSTYLILNEINPNLTKFRFSPNLGEDVTEGSSINQGNE